MIIFQSPWPQLDISSCSYQSYSVIALSLLYLVVPFFTAIGCFCLAYHTFLTRHMYNKKKGYYTLVNYMQCTINTSVCVCSSHPVTGDLTLITVD